MENFVESLKNNAVFQMSLSSKELFHSNFLAWLAEDNNTLDVFNTVLRECFGITDWYYDPETMMVCREYNNFDFCICDKVEGKNGDEQGSIRLILENKFKSIPYKKQLTEYEGKVKKLNKKAAKKKHKTAPISPSPTKYILLTLADNFLEKQEIEEQKVWKIVQYQDYVKVLNDASNGLKDDFYKKIIHRYCDFVKLISTRTNELLEQVQVSKTWAVLDLEKKDFSAVRCDDIFQKLAMQKLAQELEKLLKEQKDFPKIVHHEDEEQLWDTNNPSPINIYVGYSMQTAFVDISTLFSEGVRIHLQQQGTGPLRIGFDLKDAATKTGKKKGRGKDEEWNDKVKEQVKSLGLSFFMEIADGKSYKSFLDKEGLGYYYKYKEDEQASTKKAKREPQRIDETFQEMVEVMRKALKLSKVKHS